MRRPDFRRVFLAHTVSRAGDAFNTVALVVLVFELTDSGLGVAGTVAFEVVPVLVFSTAAGVVVDRYPRRSVMVMADLARAGVVATVAIASGSLGVAFLVAFGVSLGSVVFNPAASSLLPDVVDADELVRANALLWAAAVTIQIVIAPIAGGVIAAAGVGPAFTVNAASYLCSAVLLVRLQAGRTPGTDTTSGHRAFLGGIDAVRAQPLLRRLALAQLFAALSAGATSGLLVVLARERLDVGPAGFGILLGAIGIGAAAGTLLLHRRIRPNSPGWLFGPLAVRGLVDIGLATTRSPIAAGGLLGIYGVSTSTGTVAFQSTLQTQVPSERRGRAFAFFDMLWSVGRLTSLLAGGVIADAFGIGAVYFGGAALLLLAAAFGLAPHARSRENRSKRPTRSREAEHDNLEPDRDDNR